MPVNIPVHTPVAAFTLKTAGLLLVHTPPLTRLDKVVVSPTGTVAVPVMVVGADNTKTDLVAKQPVGRV